MSKHEKFCLSWMLIIVIIFATNSYLSSFYFWGNVAAFSLFAASFYLGDGKQKKTCSATLSPVSVHKAMPKPYKEVLLLIRGGSYQIGWWALSDKPETVWIMKAVKAMDGHAISIEIPIQPGFVIGWCELPTPEKEN